MTTNEIITLILATIAALFSIWSFFLERTRNRREATIHAFDKLQTEILGNDDLSLNKITPELAGSYVHKHKEFKNSKAYNDQWRTLTEKLALLEHFSVGINYHTYDLKVLNAMAGNLMIKIWDNLQPIIMDKRHRPDGKDNYKEFEKMVENLKRLRNGNAIRNRILGKGD